MKFLKKPALSACAACLLLSSLQAHAFGLVGPVQPWMDPTNHVVDTYDIGGPMELTHEYRWNVPVVTYGFDQSFLDFFGSSGVAAVEDAIRILNDLPPASDIVLQDFPPVSQVVNPTAENANVFDLKKVALRYLLQQLGLWEPIRSTFVLRKWHPDFEGWYKYEADWGSWAMPEFIDQLNFDPQTLAPTPYINGIRYTAVVQAFEEGHYMYPFPIDPMAHAYGAIADWGNLGLTCTNLTRDDVGGIRYLLSSENINFETLVPGVEGEGADPHSFVNGAWRPGVEKLTFLPHPTISGRFQRYTNYFVDTYLTNGTTVHQQLRRVIEQPDFLFSAGSKNFCTGTTNWITNAEHNGDPGNGGPGIIRPPVKIMFEKAGKVFINGDDDGMPPYGLYEDFVDERSWRYGSVDSPTNPVITYPVPRTGSVTMEFRLWLRHGNPLDSTFAHFDWAFTSQTGTRYALQTSTNMLQWTTLFVVENDGSNCEYHNVNANSACRFYRVVVPES